MGFRDGPAARLDVAAKLHLATDIATINGVDISGIFTETYIEMLNIQGVRPTFRCLETDIGALNKGDPVIYDGTNYKFAISEPDGTGWTLLVLSN